MSPQIGVRIERSHLYLSVPALASQFWCYKEYLGLSTLESKKMSFGSMLLKMPSQVEGLCHVRTQRKVRPLNQTAPLFDSYGEPGLKEKRFMLAASSLQFPVGYF